MVGDRYSAKKTAVYTIAIEVKEKGEGCYWSEVTWK